MYCLTLTNGERRAIDWVGNRYANGYDLYRLLWTKSKCSPEDVDWDYDGDITFLIPENMAWAIEEIGKREDNLWPCFAEPLRQKMQTFVESIV